MHCRLGLARRRGTGRSDKRRLPALCAHSFQEHRNPGSLWAEQAIGLADALRIFTVEGARAARRESVAGSLAVGKSADLIVLEKDLFEINPAEISRELLEMTWFAGELVYEKRRS